MTPVGRMIVLNLRTVAPYRIQIFGLFGLMVVLFANRPVALLPALGLLYTAMVAAYPFNVGDKANLGTLYATLPLSRRAVVLGHYAWALISYLGTVIVGIGLAVLLTRLESAPLGGRTLVAELTLSWGMFAINVAVQFPLFLRYGYSRTNAGSTILPLVIVVWVVLRLHLSLTSVESWLPWIWPAGAALILASMATATTFDRRRPPTAAAGSSAPRPLPSR